jgi:tetratricopeptide (TPR) repeat protein
MWLAAPAVLSAQATKAQLEVSETLFTTAAALNSCGYDAGLDDSLPLRAAVRREVEAAVKRSAEAAQARDAICRFWNEHQPEGTSSDITQYISLAIELGPPPLFAPTLPEADLPPDAAHVLGAVSLLQRFYRTAGIQFLWEKHRSEYQSLVQQFHDTISDVLTQADRYLKLPFSTYPGERFVVYLEPQLAPAHVDSRNYGSNYLVVISVGQDGQIKMPEIRHTYLHFVLDPLALTHGTSLKQLEPILLDIQNAPLSTAFKDDISLMVNESLIRAIEVRTSIPKSNEVGRNEAVQRSVQEGFVLTRYFYDALANFEKVSTGLKNAYGDLLHGIDLERERKRARAVAFAAEARPEIVSESRTKPSRSSLLDAAEQKLAAGDVIGAEKLARQVIQHNEGGDEPGRAAFILARIATRAGKMDEARADFEQAAQSVHDPHVLAWSHIYLGRIFDFQQSRETAEENYAAAQKSRETALEHYRAALAAGDPAADTRHAAESGLAAPYQARGPH